MSIDAGQMLWGLNSILLAILGFFVKMWFDSLKAEFAKMEINIDKKLDAAICVERNGDVKIECEKFRHHRHAPITGEKGGEVIFL